MPLTSKGQVMVGEGEAARPRRSTLETFNDELAVLDRPLEGDVEYVDEPRPSRWRPIGFVAVMVFVGVGGALFISRQRAAARMRAEAAPVATVAAAPDPAALPAAAPPPAAPPAADPAPAAEPASPVLAAQVPAAAPTPAEAVEPEGDDLEADDSASGDSAAGVDSAPRAPLSKSAWSKLRSKVGHAKHARTTSSKTTTHRRTTTTTRHTVVAKRSLSRRH